MSSWSLNLIYIYIYIYHFSLYIYVYLSLLFSLSLSLSLSPSHTHTHSPLSISLKPICDIVSLTSYTMLQIEEWRFITQHSSLGSFIVPHNILILINIFFQWFYTIVVYGVSCIYSVVRILCLCSKLPLAKRDSYIILLLGAAHPVHGCMRLKIPHYYYSLSFFCDIIIFNLCSY